MAATNLSVFDDSLQNLIHKAKILVVGAGGIGCELLKNLVLTGFEDIHIIDLDTIDISNLNRQFLFHKQHVGKPKAVVAKESAQKYNPKAKITEYYDSITNLKYDKEFFQQFSAVCNALDNLGARRHVNRMCLSADIPLVESGSSGYFGQVNVHKKGVSECFECLPRMAPKTFPACTIRSNPTEMIHCIIWAKHVFTQLFGEDGEDEASPFFESVIDMPKNSHEEAEETVSAKEYAKSVNYEPEKLFRKLFHDDIKQLHTMEQLWEDREKPIPLDFDDLSDAVAGSSSEAPSSLKDQQMWSTRTCANVFCTSVERLKKKMNEESGGNLIWDKDDDEAMDFVASCANIRAHCFRITQQSRFEVKSMAGNIVPAIATTNAVIGGLIVLELLKVLRGQFDKCRMAIVRACSESAMKMITPLMLETPNPKCIVCSTTLPEVKVRVNLDKFTLRTLQEKILKQRFHVGAPEVLLVNKGAFLISSDPEDETDLILDKTLSEVGVDSTGRLKCEDYGQQLKFMLVVCADTDLVDQDFEIVNESEIKKLIQNYSWDEDEPEKKDDTSDDDDGYDLMLLDDDVVMEMEVIGDKKKPRVDGENGTEPLRKKKKASES